MILQLNFKSGIPAYLQILEQVKYALASGALRPGDQLPSVRALAEDLRINRNTVAKAYAELEHEGIVKTLQGKGVFCRKGVSPLREETRERILVQAIDAAVVQAHHFQVGRRDFLELVRRRLDDFQERRKGVAAASRTQQRENTDER